MRGLLLDTHCFLWWLGAPHRLSDRAREAIGDGEAPVFLSAASAWEIAIKHALGKLRLPEPPERFVPSRLTREGFAPLAIRVEHATAAGRLPRHHRDPFDRMLVAQAAVEGLVLVTADAALRAYEVTLLWAAPPPAT